MTMACTDYYCAQSKTLGRTSRGGSYDSNFAGKVGQGLLWLPDPGGVFGAVDAEAF